MPKYVYLLISFVALLLIYSTASTSLYKIEPADLGLASELPLTFWIGLVLLGCLWFFCRNSQKGQIVALVLTVSFLYVAPAIIRTPVWLSASYYPFGESVLLSQTGHLVARPHSIFLTYHTWPAFLYLASVFTLVTGMPDYILLKFFPQLIIALYGLLVFLILRVKLKISYAIIGATWFLSSFFLRHYYFGPACIAYIFFLLTLLIVSWLFYGEKAEKTKLEALFLFLFVVTTFTHALTSLMLLVVVVALYLAQRFVHEGPPTARARAARLCLLSAVILLSYNVYIASRFFTVTLKTFVEIFLGRRSLGIYLESARIFGSMANRLSYASYWSIVLLNAVVAMIAIFQVFKAVRSRRQTVQKGYPVFWIILLVMLGLFAFTGEYGPHEASQRAFMFGVIPLAYLCVNLLTRKPRILLAILVGLLFLNIPAQYGGDSYTLATDTQLAGVSFFVEYAPQNTTCFSDFSLYFRYHDPQTNIRFTSIGTLPFTTFPNSSSVNEAMNEADYIILSEIQSNYYLYFLGENPLDLVDFGGFNRIYDSESFRTFVHANTTSSP